MKKIYLLAIGLLMHTVATAQYNLGTTYVGHNDINSHRYEPSELDLGEKRFQIGLNTYTWIGNTNITMELIEDFFNQDSLDTSTKEKYLNELSSENLFGAGAEVSLAVAYQFRNKKGKKIDFSFGVADKANIVYEFSEEIARFALFGNGDGALRGQDINLGTNTFEVNYYREWAVGAAFPLFGNPGDQEGIGMRAGVRAKYLQGKAGISMEGGRATINTAEDGSSIGLTYDYVLHTAGVDEVNSEDFFLNQSNGSGMGLDLGLALFLGKHWEINASVTDIGKITYDNNVTLYQHDAAYEFEGLIITQFFGDDEADIGELPGYLYEPEESEGEEFDMDLGTRLLLQVEYKVPTKEVVKVKKNGEEKTIEYSPHTFFLTYVQGFQDAPGSTSRPFASLGYNYNFHKSFDMGVMAGWGGYNQALMGMFLDVNLGNFWKVGLGSDNLAPLIVPSAGTGIDLQFSTSFSF